MARASSPSTWRCTLRWGAHTRGHRVRQGGVVYIALEGGNGFPARVDIWRQRNLGDDDPGAVPFYLLHNVSIDLIAQRDELVADLRLQLPELPAVVFIDTLNRALNGDENSPVDMGKLVRAADAITAAFGCLVVLVHHCGHAGGRPRGHSSLSGADDVEISVTMADDGLITIAVDAMKDGPTCPPFAARLESLRLGVDDDGDPLISCIVVPASASTGASIRLTANQSAFVDILREVSIDAPATPLELRGASNLPNDLAIVSRDMLKKYCLSKGWLDVADTANCQRAKLSNMLNALAGKHVIGRTDRFVWIIR